LIYARAKDIRLELFPKDETYSDLQVEFLFWLEIYHQLHQQLYTGDPLLTDKIMGCDVSVDAYLHYRRKHKHDEPEPDKFKRPQEKRTKGNSPHSYKLVQKGA
jgi:hypothetical protein